MKREPLNGVSVRVGVWGKGFRAWGLGLREASPTVEKPRFAPGGFGV